LSAGLACRLAGAGVVAFLLAAAPTSALAADPPHPACGHANLDNPGNHYGLIKNGCLPGSPTPPAPQPSPAAIPTAIPTPISTPASRPAVTQAPVAPVTAGPSETPAAAAGPVYLIPAGDESEAPQGEVATVRPSGDTSLWLLEALLPTLIVVWLILLGGARSFEFRAPAVKENPA
jgi:hypothetical protein